MPQQYISFIRTIAKNSHKAIVIIMSKDLRISIAIFIGASLLYIALCMALWFYWDVFGLLIALSILFGILTAVVAYTFRLSQTGVRQLTKNIEALFSIDQVLDISFPLPNFGGYRISHQLAKRLIATVLEYQPKTIVELGCGTSTVVLSYALKHLGRGKILSIEHCENFANNTRHSLALHHLSESATVHVANLHNIVIDGSSWHWYDIDRVQNLPERIDLLFVDGPPAKTQKLARYPALSQFLPRLSENAVVILDDAYRSDEIQIAKRWIHENPEFKLEIDSDTGCAFLFRNQSR